MKHQTYPAEKLAELLAVSIDCLKRWRTKGMRGTALYLPAAGGTPRKPEYLVDDILTFLRRNEGYRQVVLAALAPKPEVEFLTFGHGLLGPHETPDNIETQHGAEIQ